MTLVDLEVGPVARPSAEAWIGWAHGICRELRDQPPSDLTPSVDALDDVDAYLVQWTPQGAGDTFRWQAEIDLDELEFLVQGLFALDACCRAQAQRQAPAEGRPFYVVLIGALLHALETECPVRAAFADRLRAFWPTAADAN